MSLDRLAGDAPDHVDAGIGGHAAEVCLHAVEVAHCAGGLVGLGMAGLSALACTEAEDIGGGGRFGAWTEERDSLIEQVDGDGQVGQVIGRAASRSPEFEESGS
jgi:hypothetical protein